MAMTYNEIVNIVSRGESSLVFLAKNFGGKNLIGTFLKNDKGELTKVHGKSANLAKSVLLTKDGVVRSYGVATATIKNKSKKVFMTEFTAFYLFV